MHELEPEQGHEREVDWDTSSRAASLSPSFVPRAQQQHAARSFAAAANVGRGRGDGTTSSSPRVVRPRHDDGDDADPHADEDADDWVFGPPTTLNDLKSGEGVEPERRRHAASRCSRTLGSPGRL